MRLNRRQFVRTTTVAGVAAAAAAQPIFGEGPARREPQSRPQWTFYLLGTSLNNGAAAVDKAAALRRAPPAAPHR